MKSSRLVSRLSRAATLRVALAGLLAVPIAACGGGSSGGGTTTPSTPSGPSQAAVTVSYTNTSWSLGGVSGFTYSFGFTITIRETAGLGVRGNFLRADFYDGANGTGALVERQEVGSNILGSLAANGTETQNLLVGFNAGSASSVVMTLNVTDARGNVLENRQTFNCC
jgi:hypothetical protein